MAISEKQLKANQENAKLGGVKTEEGKEAVKYNAIKHGLLSKKIIIEGESEEEFKDLERGVLEELNPVGTMANLLADKIIVNIWRLKRLLVLERNVIDYARNDQEELVLFDDENQKIRKKEVNIVDSNFIDRILRYEVAIERSLYKAIKEYKSNKNGFV